VALHDLFGFVNLDLLGAAGNSKVPVLGGRITPLDLDGTVSMMLEMVRCRTGGYICIANVHTTVLALQVNEFRKALDGAALVVADGMPVVWRVRAAGYPGTGRVHGADLVHAACAAGIPYGLRHGFFGGWNGTAEMMASRLKQRYPSLHIAGVWGPGLINEGDQSPPELLQAINDAQCDILWVGIGAPKQEIWMAQHRAQLRAPVLVGVGQAFDILAGRISRPPAWMGSHGLEWLYRLAHDPRRLGKRYLVYNSLFAWYLFLETFGYTSHHAQP
jgi:exopolysaccharide biosynthesis WecB/TagA/CpsF family protein